MVYTVQSPSGKSYDFDDNVPEADAAYYIRNVAEKPQSWKNVIQQIPQDVRTGIAKANAGIVTTVEDYLVKPIMGVADTPRKIQNVAREAMGQKPVDAEPYQTPETMQRYKDTAKFEQQLQKLGRDGTPTLAQEAVSSAGTSLVEGAIDIVGGAGAMVAGRRAGLALKDAAAAGMEFGLRNMAGREAARTYGEQREAGMPVHVATAAAITAGIAEYAPEKWAGTKLLDVVAAKSGPLKGVMDFLVKDLVGEEATTAIQAINRKLTTEPNMTVEQYLREAAVTAMSTGISGPIQAGTGKAVYAGASRLAEKPQVESKPWVEPSGQIPPESPASGPVASPSPLPEAFSGEPPAAPGEAPTVVRDKGTGRLDGGEVLVGVDSTPQSAELPPEMALELLRDSYKKSQESSFSDTAEDKIRRKAEFNARRAAFEQQLKLYPEARALLREGDAGMNITAPSYNVDLEQEVEEYATLEPEVIQYRQAVRESTKQEAQDSPSTVFPQDLREQLGVSQGAQKFNEPTDQGDYASSYSQHERDSLVGRVVQWSSNPEFVGKTWEQIRNFVKPGQIVYAAKAPLNEDARGQLIQLLEPLLEKYLPNTALVIGDYAGKNEVHSAARWSGPNLAHIVAPQSFQVGATKSFFVQSTNLVKAYLGRQQTEMTPRTLSQIDTILHEFTHLIHQRHFQSSPPAEKQAVAREYHSDLRQALKEDVQTALSRLYSPDSAQSFMDNYVRDGGQLSDAFTSDRARKLLPQWSKPDYYFNFSEWMAHKGVRYFQTRLGVSQENVGFFRRWLVKMRDFYQNVVMKFVSNAPSFNTWMDNIATFSSRGSGLVNESTIQATRDYLISSGAHPDLANALTTLRGDDSGYIETVASMLRDEAQTADIEKNITASLAELGNYLKTTKRSEFEKKLQGWPVVKALLQKAPFNNYRKFNPRHLLDSALGSYVNSKRVEITVTGPGNVSYLFRPNPGSPSLLMLRYKDGSLSFTFNDWPGRAGEMLQIGLINHALRDIVQRYGAETVWLSRDKVSQDVLDYYDAIAPEGMPSTSIVEIPYFIYEPPVVAKDSIPEGDAMILDPSALWAAGKQFGSSFFQRGGNSLARFNYFYRKTLGAFNLIKLNEHVPGMQQEKEALRNRMSYRHQWLKIANDRIDTWAFKMDKGQSAKVSRMLFEEAESGVFYGQGAPDPNNPGHYIFTLPQSVMQSKGLTVEAAELYSNVRNDFMRFADEWNKVGLWEIARAHLSQPAHVAIAEMMRKDGQVRDVEALINVALQSVRDPNTVARVLKQVQDLNDQFTAWKAKPYMPYTRFGRYGILVKDSGTGDTKYFEGYETQLEARQASLALRSRFPGDAVSLTYIEDVPFQLAGLPPAMLTAMQGKLNLTNQQLDQFAEILQQLSHANSFAHRQAHKAGIAGYSQDAMRAYSDYFRRGSAYMARVKSEPELNDAMNILQGFIKQETQRNVDVNDLVKLGKLHEYFMRHHAYLSNPGNEYGELKSMLSLFHFGFNLSTAAINMGQVPLVTLPWLSERYGNVASMSALKTAYGDVAKIWHGKSPLRSDEIAMLDYASKAGFRDESQATVLAQIADGGALARASPSGAFSRGLNTFNHYAMWAFGKGELVNRDVTLLAAYRLSRGKNYAGVFDKDAFEFARTAVEDTHNEYSQENRPEMMQGAGGVVLQFMHYSVQMLFLTLGGDKSWWRILLAQMAFAGILGMPFAGDLANAAKFIGRRVLGQDWDVEREARMYLAEMGANADLILRGVSSNVFGADLSKRVSLGEIVPGMAAVGSHRKFQDAMYAGIGDFAGPAASVFTNLLQFVAENDKTSWDAMKKILPTSAKNFGNAVQAFNTGAVKDRSGAVLFEPDTWDVLQMAVGFSPKEVNEKYTARNLQQEQAAYWTHRKQVLLDIWDHIVFDRNNDREAVSDFMDRLEVYNENAPDPRLRITGKTLQQSVKRKAEARMYKEMGLGSNPAMRGSAKAISDTWNAE